MPILKNHLLHLLTQTTIDDLLKSDKPHFIKSIATDLDGLTRLRQAARQAVTLPK